MSAATELADSRYVLLTTFRKDGSPVSTPVWVVPCDDGFSVWTGRSSGKVKRIRRNARVRVATCNGMGKKVGPAREGHAELLPPQADAQIKAALRKKYGWWAAQYVRFAERGDRKARMVNLKVTVEGEAASDDR